ncbi:hypothetical protein KR49_06440 [Synechococcus sp. KORDI-49]|nr:hypothetical protein KR49_06440 [Synechococcus sp. KORDI-49]
MIDNFIVFSVTIKYLRQMRFNITAVLNRIKTIRARYDVNLIF